MRDLTKVIPYRETGSYRKVVVQNSIQTDCSEADENVVASDDDDYNADDDLD